MLYYFYCPNCGYEKQVAKLPLGTCANLRDGYGTPIYHYECPQCHNLDAGYMAYDPLLDNGSHPKEAELYFQHVISLYQGVRGFKNEMD